MVRVAIVGATGYGGAEALRLLLSHPAAEVTYLASHGHAGQSIGSLHPQLGRAGAALLRPVDAAAIAAEADVALCALPSRQSLELAPALCAQGLRVIDFGADFRLRDAGAYARFYGGAHTSPGWLARAVYGLTEFHRSELPAAPLVANPGCYPTAALLALWPALAAGAVLAEDIIVDAKSGVSGAGRQPAQSSHFPEADGNVWPYRIAGEHRHTPEIAQELSRCAGTPVRLTFSPHQIPMSRGLLATCYARLARAWTTAEAAAHYQRAYAGEPFVEVLGTALPSTKATLGCNAAQVAVRVDAGVGRLVAVCALDNLGKGAAGQAVQNLNVMFGLQETLGLSAVGLAP